MPSELELLVSSVTFHILFMSDVELERAVRNLESDDLQIALRVLPPRIRTLFEPWSKTSNADDVRVRVSRVNAALRELERALRAGATPS